MNKILHIYDTSGNEIKTYSMSEFGDYEYYKVDKRIKVYDIDTQYDTYMSARYRPYFYFNIYNADKVIYYNLLSYEELQCDFVLQVGGKYYDVIISESNRNIVYPYSEIENIKLVFEGLNVYKSPIVDVASEIDTIYISNKPATSNNIVIYNDDLLLLHVHLDKAVNVSISQNNNVYDSVHTSDATFTVKKGLNTIIILGNYNNLIVWGE